MKLSIRTQMMTALVGVVAAMMLAFMMINGGFLERYYVNQKVQMFVNAYSMISEIVESEELVDSTEFENNERYPELVQLLEKSHISALVVNTDYTLVFTNEKGLDKMVYRLQGHLFDKTGESVIEESETYNISKTSDKKTGTEYIDMWGQLSGGEIFILESPLESIREVVGLFNRFVAVVGVILTLVSILIAWFFSKKITDPLRELAELSKKMADLDFDAKYTSGGKNEIGVLGESFNQMSEKLKSTISELKSANNQLQKDIEQKEKLEQMRTEFLGNVSHELKTPIALIQGYAEGLKEGVSDDPESREFYCDVIMDEAGKMNRMVKNLLTLNQLEAGEEVLYDRFDLTELIRGVLCSMELLIEQKEVTMIFRRETSAYVWADEYKVEQVVRNYVSNALNHVDFDKVIEIKIDERDDVTHISVFNTGKPIPEEDVDRIWEKFYKVDKARTREYGGNGIGLSIVKAIMESMHRDFGVNNYDNGVEFWFELDRK